MGEGCFLFLCLSPDRDRGFLVMFTGIISNLGEIKKIDKRKYFISAEEKLISKLAIGDSIAVNGICLTVKDFLGKDTFMVEVMPETEKKTMLAYLKKGDKVNLELPMTMDRFFSGHLVQGHVDATATLLEIKKEANSRILTFMISEPLSKYIVNKGAIAVNGVSLTVIKAAKDWFCVGIIPHTWENTTFKQIKVGDKVNIEVDIIAKYVEKLISAS